MDRTRTRYEPLPPFSDDVHTPFSPFREATPEDYLLSQGEPIRMQTLPTSPASLSRDWSQPANTQLSGCRADSPGILAEGKSRSTVLGWRMSGWRSTARLAAAAALLTLMVNLGATIWAASIALSPAGLLRRVYQGDCPEIEKINTWVHLVINILSTVLLSGSNYCMQCLSAPTREEVNKAHKKGKWLDIGVYSARNLSSISRKKKWLWWLLGWSSVPLHLMYNSAFFSSLANNDYNVVFATEGWLSGATYNTSGTGYGRGATYNPSSTGYGRGASYNTSSAGHGRDATYNTSNADHARGPQFNWLPREFDVSMVLRSISDFELLNNAKCIEAYATDMTPDRRTIVVVCDETSTQDGNSLLGGYNYKDFYTSYMYKYEW